MNIDGISRATQQACMQTFGTVTEKRSDMLQQLGESLPPFHELVKVIEGSDSNECSPESYRSSTQSPNEVERDARRVSASPQNKSYNSQPNNLNTLADVMTSRNFSELPSTHRRESGIYSYLVHFLSTTKCLDDCFQELYHQLQLKEFNARINMNEANHDMFLQGKDSHGEEHDISREDFRKWIVQVPTIMYENISEALVKFSSLLDELKTMKRYYQLEEKVKEVEGQLTRHPKVDSSTARYIYNDDLKIEKRHKLYKATAPKKMTNYIRTGPDHFQRTIKKRRGKAKNSEVDADSCSHCATMATPEWRKGPTGSRTLCNACGLFYSKLTKRFGSEGALVVFDFRKKSNLTADRTVPSHGEFENMKSPLE